MAMTTHAPRPVDEGRRKAVDEDRCKAVIAGDDLAALFELRAQLIETSNRIKSQLAFDDAAAMEELVEGLNAGMTPGEAGLLKARTTDHDWRARAKGLLRFIDSWITKIRARIVQLSPSSRPIRAVCLPGIARDGESVTSAINQLMDKGCKVLSFGVVGTDLVVVASEPWAPISKLEGV